MLDLEESVVVGGKVCDKCRKMLSAEWKEANVEAVSESSTSETSDSQGEGQAEPDAVSAVTDMEEEIERKDAVEAINVV